LFILCWERGEGSAMMLDLLRHLGVRMDRSTIDVPIDNAPLHVSAGVHAARSPEIDLRTISNANKDDDNRICFSIYEAAPLIVQDHIRTDQL
jgi:hypothetical protein